MVQPQVIQGSREELTAFLEHIGDRKNLILIVPAEENQREPNEEEIAAANARLRRHIVTFGSAGDLDNDSIDVDLADVIGVVDVPGDFAAHTRELFGEILEEKARKAHT